MLVKPTVAQLLTKAENRYRLVIASSKRARELSTGAKPMIDKEEPSPVSTAADEIYDGKLIIYNKTQWEDLKKYREQKRKEAEMVANEIIRSSINLDDLQTMKKGNSSKDKEENTESKQEDE